MSFEMIGNDGTWDRENEVVYTEDQLHELLFGMRTEDGEPYITEGFRSDIDKIRRNDPSFTTLSLDRVDNYLIKSALELLGFYVARNDQITEIDLSDWYCNPDDVNFLFEKLTASRSVRLINMTNCTWGQTLMQSAGTCRNMVPFFENSTNLKEIYMENAEGFSTQCFEMMVTGLSGGPIESICIDEGSIDSIEALENCSLPHLNCLSLDGHNISKLSGLDKLTALETLHLCCNPIDKAGCIVIAKLLENQHSKLTELCLTSTGIGDEGSEIIANSLKENNVLCCIEMDTKKMTDKGGISFLKLLCDISSIGRTYNSNHVIDSHHICPDHSESVTRQYIEMATNIVSGSKGNSAAIGRSKVIKFQLNGQNREELCLLQGIDFCYDSIFAEFDSVVLPNVLELVGRHHWLSELFKMISSGVPVLEDLMNREEVLMRKIAEKRAQIFSLTNEIREMNEELDWIRGKGIISRNENCQATKRLRI